MENKDLLNILISLICGFIGGGISSWVVITKSKIKQKSGGNYSPNIAGDANRSQFGKK